MCSICGYVNCHCHSQHVTVTPCEPCVQTEGCKIKVPVKCVTIGNSNLEEFLKCTNLLDYIYNCIIADPTRYAKFCLLWAGCNGEDICAAPTNLSISSIGTTSATVSWTQISGVTYNVYRCENDECSNTTLIQSNASSPLVVTDLTPDTIYTIKIIAVCSNDATNFTTSTFQTTAIPNLVFAWERTSGDSKDLSSSINGTFDYIDWGDGTINSSISHQYNTSGTFTVKIYNTNTTLLTLGTEFGPQIYNVTSVTVIPDTLVSLSLPRCTLTSIPSLIPLTNLATLNIIKNSLTSLDLSGNTQLSTLKAEENNFTGILAIGANIALTYINIDSNGFTSITGLASCPDVLYFSAVDNNFAVSAINGFLTTLDSAGLLNGTCITNAQTPTATPSGAGITAKSSLISNGWTVTTD